MPRRDTAAEGDSSTVPAERQPDALTPSSPHLDTEAELQESRFRGLDGTRPSKDSSSPELRSLSSSPELPEELAARLAGTAADPALLASTTSADNDDANADALRGRSRSDRIRNLESQRDAANPRRILPLPQRRAPRPRQPTPPSPYSPDPPEHVDENGFSHRADGHTMMVQQFRDRNYPRADTSGGQLISSDADYAVSFRHRPAIARQARVSPPPPGYTGPVAGGPTRIALPGGNSDPKIRAMQMRMATVLTAWTEKEDRDEEEGDSTLLNSDGVADEEANGGGRINVDEAIGESAVGQEERVIPDSQETAADEEFEVDEGAAVTAPLAPARAAPQQQFKRNTGEGLPDDFWSGRRA